MSDFKAGDRLVSDFSDASSDAWVWRVVDPDIEGTGDILLHCDNYGYAAIRARDVTNWRKVEPVQVFEFRRPKPGEKWLGFGVSARDYIINDGRWADCDVYIENHHVMRDARFVFVEERYK